MKYYIVASIIVVVVLAALYVAVDSSQPSSPSPSGRPDTNDIRNLRIN